MTRIKFVDLPPFQDATKIEARLMATLRRLRDLPRQANRAVWEDEDDFEPKVKGKPISYNDSQTVKRRASLLATRQAAYAGVAHLKKDELARLTPAMQGVDLMMAVSEHWADEVAASLHADMPWMGPATEYAWHALRRAARRGEAICLRPVILNGPPGIGKSVWARKLSKLLSVPTADIDASKGGAGFALCGLDRGWATALAGRPLDLILGRRIGNPVMIVDEICKAKRGTSTSGTGFSFADALLSLIEPATSTEWECPYFRLRFDMSHIVWVMTANNVHKVPETVRSRCQLIQLPDITPAQLNEFARVQGQKMGLSEPGVEAILKALDRAPKLLGRRLSLRDVIRALERGEGLEERPWVQ
jgi:hypothetical protein